MSKGIQQPDMSQMMAIDTTAPQSQSHTIPHMHKQTKKLFFKLFFFHLFISHISWLFHRLAFCQCIGEIGQWQNRTRIVVGNASGMMLMTRHGISIQMKNEFIPTPSAWAYVCDASIHNSESFIRIPFKMACPSFAFTFENSIFSHWIDSSAE